MIELKFHYDEARKESQKRPLLFLSSDQILIN